MRTVFTVLLGLAFVPLFVLGFMANSILGYPTDSVAVTGTLKEADAYGSVVKLVDLGIKETVNNAKSDVEVQIAKKFTESLTPTLKDAVPEKNFYEMIETTHSGFVTFLNTGTDTSQVDLVPAKQKIKDYLKKVVREVSDVEGGADDPERIEKIEKECEDILKEIPDKFNLTAMISKSKGDSVSQKGTESLKEVREGLNAMRTTRTVVMVFLALVFGLIVVASISSPKRLLISTGLCLFLAGISYYPIVGISSSAVQGLLDDEFKKEEVSKNRTEAAIEGTRIGAKLTVAIFQKSLGRSNSTVIFLSILGLGMFVGGLLLKSPAAETGERTAGAAPPAFPT